MLFIVFDWKQSHLFSENKNTVQNKINDMNE